MTRNISALILVTIIICAIKGTHSGHPFLTPGGAGYALGSASAVLLCTAIFVLIVAGFYWLAKRQKMPNLGVFTWVVWGVTAVMALT